MRRVTKVHPCPICQRPDWCGIADDASVAICMRVPNGAVKQTRNGGWLHRLQDVRCRPARRMVQAGRNDPDAASRADYGSLAARCAAAVNSDRLQRLADELVLSVASLHRLDIGWSADHRAWTFPMTDAGGRVLGIRLRRANGFKFAVRGGHDGLFIPSDLTSNGPLLICEGPTDTTALIDLGFNAVGRASCTGGTRLLVELIKRRGRPEAVIVTDADEPGRRGAEALASVLAAYSPVVRVIQPPDGLKDARQWKQRGATHQDIQQFIEVATPRSVVICGRGVRTSQRT